MPATGSLQLVEAVIEHFDGAPVGERRRWSDEFKAQAVAAALEPGVNVSALARGLGISPPQLFGWRKVFLKKQNADAPVGTSAPMVETEDGEAQRRDDQYMYVSCWKYAGEGEKPILLKEPLNYEAIKVQTRNYKS
jgi:transposase